MKYKEDYISELVKNYKSQIDLLRTVKLSKNSSDITHQQIIPFSTYSPWYDDKEFLQVYNKVKGYTLVDIYRCYELWSFVKMRSHLEGDILEVGVWRGGTGAILSVAASQDPACKIFLADTFTGVVKASEKDTIYKGGEHSDTNIDYLKELIVELKLSNTTILKGIFPDEVNLGDKIPSVKICHIDVDTYNSARDIFNYIWPNVIKGGAVIFDDYGFWGCEGITTFCNDVHLKDATFVHNINGHGIFIKY